jgi:hypothetical protein
MDREEWLRTFAGVGGMKRAIRGNFMRRLENIGIVLAVLAGLGLGLQQAAQAQVMDYGSLTTSLPEILQGSDPAATLSFTLNTNGTITVTAKANSADGVDAFGYAGSTYYAMSNLTSGAATLNSSGWVSSTWGDFTGGWQATGGALSSVTGTIGSPGSFSSIAQLFTPNSKGYEFFVETENAGGSLFTAYAGETLVAAPVPEPSSAGLMLAGLGVCAWALRRRRRT